MKVVSRPLTVGKSGNYYVFIPIAEELDMKKGGKVCGRKVGGDVPCEGYKLLLRATFVVAVHPLA